MGIYDEHLDRNAANHQLLDEVTESLRGDLDAFLDEFRRDGALEVQPAPHRTGGAQYLVDGLRAHPRRA